MAVELYALQVKCFEMVGCTKKSLIKSPKQTFGLLTLNFVSVWFGVFGMTAFIFENFNDVLSASNAACPLFSDFNAAVKLAVFQFVQEKIFELIDEMREMSVKAARLHPETIRWMEKGEKYSASLFLVTASATGLFYILAPIFNMFVEVVIRKQKFNYNLPFKASFPYDVTFFPSYVITYFLESFGTYLTVIFSVRRKKTRFLKIWELFLAGRF